MRLFYVHLFGPRGSHSTYRYNWHVKGVTSLVTGKVKFHKISACDTQAVIINSDKQDKMIKGAQLKVL